MNTPNKITIARICLIPLIVFFYLATFIPWNFFIAGILFVLASVTDFVDGYLARKNNQVTDLGKFLDTIADKILVASALILLVALPINPLKIANVDHVSSITKPNWLGIVFAVIILAREFAVSALRMVAASKGKVLAAERNGKVKTAFTMVTLSLYFFYAFYVREFFVDVNNFHHHFNAIIGFVLIIMFGISALMTLSSGWQYFSKYAYLFKSVHAINDVRAQEIEGPIVKAALDKSAALLNEQTKSPSQKQETQASSAPKTDKNGRAFDELIPQALDMFLSKGWASTTMLQKHLGVGYPRASKIVDQMEELGYISPVNGKTRKVLITKEEYQKLMKK